MIDSNKDRKKITVDIPTEKQLLFFGPGDEVLSTLERLHAGVQFFVQEDGLLISGSTEAATLAAKEVASLLKMHEKQGALTSADVASLHRQHLIPETEYSAGPESKKDTILQVRGKSVRPQTKGQRAYVEAIKQNTITFGIGPAGTGKTFLAVAMAVQALQARRVSRIILTRPAVEAGERLGYLPGTLSEKIDPYLRPLFDAAAGVLENDAVSQLLSSGAIEVAPLAYMRGRTLNESFVILDEAQNTTPDQMKMFLTRLGFGSQMVVTGDPTQADLPGGKSGLKIAARVLKNVPDIAMINLTSDDIVRHSLVGAIVDAYNAHSRDESSSNDT